MRLLVKFKTILLIIAAVLLIGAVVFFIWASNPLGPMPETDLALQSSNQIDVQTNPWLTFSPTETEPDTGLILYPGGRVDPRSYAPLARAIAEDNYLVVIPPMPLNLAVFNPAAADDIITTYDEVTNWVIGGHSLGGAMAANYAYNNPGAVDGLILWASYPAENNSLADQTDLPVLSIYGTEDGQAAELAAAAGRLPPATLWTVIEGGNHAQFGWYGPQSGDGEAAISREEQQSQIIQATTALLARSKP
jgi:pimeloyl-ACP methyl ester carboxylesterase